MFTKTFKQINKGDASIAGGKGASLGEMISSGIPVPDGFVVLSTTFDKFLEITDINIEIDAILNKVKHNEVHTVENASKQIQTLILNSNIPEDIAKEIKKEFKKLNSKYVAVRSSATAEDSASAAWAGQLDSFLNTTEDTLLENVKRCFASLFTPRAIFYRFEKKLDKQKISVAVVVQKMVNSDVSGIAFSVHPVTEDYNQIIIEAGFGLGEAIVSGQITPDSYVVTKDNLNILDKNAYTQERGIFRDNKKGGNEWKDISKNKGEKQCLSDKQIIELSELIIKIENHYKFPCDIEWAMENNKFYIVQSRPITTLKENLRNEYSEKRKEVEERDLKLYNEFIGSLKGNEMFTFSGPYSNLAICGTAWSNEKYYKKYFTKSKAFYGLCLIKGKEVFASIDNYYYRQYAVEYLQKFVDKKISLEDIRINYNFLDEKINLIYNKKITNPSQTIKKSYDLLVHLIAATVYIELFDKEVVQEVLNRKIEDNIWKKVSNPDFEHFEERWNKLIKKSKSHQEVDFVFMDYFFLPSEKELENKWKQERKKIAKEKNNKGFIMDDEPWMKFVQFAIKLRDIRKDPIAKLQVLICKSARMLYPGVEDSLLAHISCLEIIEKKLPSVNELIKRRDKGYVLLVRSNDTYEYNYESYQEIKDLINKTNDDVSIIQGVSASSGVYQGTVKIILDPSNSKNFKKGDVLVTGMTRPDFVPLMKKAGAIITAEGGVTCHAAIVSRELGVPCVIGTKIAVKVLKDGDKVEVDADKGVVRVLKEKHKEENKLDLGFLLKLDIVYEISGVFNFLLMDIIINNFVKDVSLACIIKDNKFSFFVNKKSLEKRILNNILPTLSDEKKMKGFSDNFKILEENINNSFTSIKKNKNNFNSFISFFSAVEDFLKKYNSIDISFSNENEEYLKSKGSLVYKNYLKIGYLRNKLRVIVNSLIISDNSLFLKTVRQFARKFNIDSNEILFYKKEEVFNLNKRRILSKLSLKKRRNFSAILRHSNRVDYYDNKVPLQIKNIMNYNQNLLVDKKVIQGNIAFGNNTVKGDVFIFPEGNINRINYQIKKILDVLSKKNNKNDLILVTKVSVPEMAPLFKKFKAIIVDFGGLNSHAAIIAREFKVPCVVETKIATKIFKNNDKLEINFKNGKIKKI